MQCLIYVLTFMFTHTRHELIYVCVRISLVEAWKELLVIQWSALMKWVGSVVLVCHMQKRGPYASDGRSLGSIIQIWYGNFCK